MKKALSLLLTIVIALGVIGPVKTNAAETLKQTATMYKGQTLLLWMSFNGEQQETSSNTWTIKSGKKNVKLVNDGQFIKATKKGKAVLTTKVNGQTAEITINVKKAPKAKQTTIKVDGKKIKVPKNYIAGDPDKTGFTAASVKDDSHLSLFNIGESIPAESFDEINEGYYGEIEKTLNDQLKANGYKIKSTELKSEDGFEYLEVKCTTPKVNYYVTYEVVTIDNNVYIVTMIGLNKKTVKSTFENFKKINNATLTVAVEAPKQELSDDAPVSVGKNGLYYIDLGYGYKTEIDIPDTWNPDPWDFSIYTEPESGKAADYSISYVEIGDEKYIKNEVESLKVSDFGYKNISLDKLDYKGSKKQSYILKWEADFCKYAEMYVASDTGRFYLRISARSYDASQDIDKLAKEALANVKK